MLIMILPVYCFFYYKSMTSSNFSSIWSSFVNNETITVAKIEIAITLTYQGNAPGQVIPNKDVTFKTNDNNKPTVTPFEFAPFHKRPIINTGKVPDIRVPHPNVPKIATISPLVNEKSIDRIPIPKMVIWATLICFSSLLNSLPNALGRSLAIMLPERVRNILAEDIAAARTAA